MKGPQTSSCMLFVVVSRNLNCACRMLTGAAEYAAETDNDMEPTEADRDFIDDSCRSDPATFYNALENGKQPCLVLQCFPVHI